MKFEGLDRPKPRTVVPQTVARTGVHVLVMKESAGTVSNVRSCGTSGTAAPWWQEFGVGVSGDYAPSALLRCRRRDMMNGHETLVHGLAWNSMQVTHLAVGCYQFVAGGRSRGC
jgi:hypothetical protein